MQFQTVDLELSVARRLEKICKENYRSASDQVRMMLDVIEGKAKKPVVRKKSTAPKPEYSLTLEDEESQTFLIMTYAGKVKAANKVITVNNVMSCMVQDGCFADLERDQVSTAMSNLAGAGFLKRTGSEGIAAVYQMEGKGWARIRDFV